MKNLILIFSTVLIIPLYFINLSSGVIGGLWLIFIYGNWGTPLFSFGVSMIAPFVLSFPLMISLIFAIPAFYVYSKLGIIGKLLSFPLMILSGLTSWIIFSFWGLFVFSYAIGLSGINSPDFIPHLLIAYSVSVSPWQYMASKEPRDNYGIILPLTFTQVGAATNLVLIGFFSIDLVIAGLIYLGVMLFGFIVSLASGFIGLKPQGSTIS